MSNNNTTSGMEWFQRWCFCLLFTFVTHHSATGVALSPTSGWCRTSGSYTASDHTATLDISGRDQQDQRLYLKRNLEHLVWNLERTETELWKEPPDPIVEAAVGLLTAQHPTWSGTTTELVSALQVDLTPNALGMRLSLQVDRLLEEFHIQYTSTRSHAGRRITLTLLSA
jgi:hypothetical protein